MATAKLRLSQVAVCVLCCFFGLGFEGVCVLRLLYGRIATFNVDAMLKLLSVTGATAFVARLVRACVDFGSLIRVRIEAYAACDFQQDHLSRQ